VRDRTNIRNLALGDLGPPFDLIVADLSFISLRLVIPNLIGQGRDGTDIVLLVKPQFEATKVEASRGKGVIRDPDVWRRVLADIADELVMQGANVLAGTVSPIRGTEGNIEFLIHAALPEDNAARRDQPLIDVDDLVTQAIRVGR
jgi:23S rRNA (cytidine1920-2'-O)/16S rRNA (cytidine1409-2'-O)-methyltransferase